MSYVHVLGWLNRRDLLHILGVSAGAQQFLNPHQLIQQPPPHGQIIPSGSSTNPTQAITPQMMLVQGGMSPQHPSYSHLQVTGIVPQIGQSRSDQDLHPTTSPEYFM